ASDPCQADRSLAAPRCLMLCGSRGLERIADGPVRLASLPGRRVGCAGAGWAVGVASTHRLPRLARESLAGSSRWTRASVAAVATVPACPGRVGAPARATVAADLAAVASIARGGRRSRGTAVAAGAACVRAVATVPAVAAVSFGFRRAARAAGAGVAAGWR